MKPSESNSEWLTRKRLIDPKLKAAGWKVVPFSTQQSFSNNGPCAIEEYETANGPADYALCVDGRIVGIVEAKKLTLGPQSVLTQAERYSKAVSDSPFNYFADHGSECYVGTDGESTNEMLSLAGCKAFSARGRLLGRLFHTRKVTFS